MNPYFKETPDADLFSEEAFSAARSQFYENRQQFENRLFAAQYLDGERFEATLLWLGTLKRFHDANFEAMDPDYFDIASQISNQLKVLSQYSKTQNEICAAALTRWGQAMSSFGVQV